MRYADRQEAGEFLAESLTAYTSQPDTIVLGLPRGGVLVAAAVARRLDLPLDVIVIRKLSMPAAPEVAFGAVSAAGPDARDATLESRLGPDTAGRIAAAQRAEAIRRDEMYRQGRPPLDLTGQVAILVDDGLATGASATAAINAAYALGAARVVLAVPVGAADATWALATVADEVICPLTPRTFTAVSPWYRDFDQVDDAEVRAVLADSR